MADFDIVSGSLGDPVPMVVPRGPRGEPGPSFDDNPHNRATFDAERSADEAWNNEFEGRVSTPRVEITEDVDLEVTAKQIENQALLLRLKMPPPPRGFDKLADTATERTLAWARGARSARQRNAWRSDAQERGDELWKQKSAFRWIEQERDLLEAIKLLRTRIDAAYRPVFEPSAIGLKPTSENVVGSIRWGKLRLRLEAYQDRLVDLRQRLPQSLAAVALSCQLDWELREINDALPIYGQAAIDFHRIVQRAIVFRESGLAVAKYYGIAVGETVESSPTRSTSVWCPIGYEPKEDRAYQIVPGSHVPWLEWRAVRATSRNDEHAVTRLKWRRVWSNE